jgi:hypothetical protein
MKSTVDPSIDEATLAVLLSGDSDPELFFEGAPTSLALRLYAEDALSPEGAARVQAALTDPIHARRLARIVEDAAAHEAALLRELTGAAPRDDAGVIVALRSRASPLKHLCRPRELSIAASGLPGGVVQTSDRDDLVTLKVAERFEAAADEGEIEVEVCTFDDPRLVGAFARLEVVAGNKVVREYRFQLKGQRFEGRFGIRRLPHASDSVEFRLYLSAAS